MNDSLATEYWLGLDGFQSQGAFAACSEWGASLDEVLTALGRRRLTCAQARSLLRRKGALLGLESAVSVVDAEILNEVTHILLRVE